MAISVTPTSRKILKRKETVDLTGLSWSTIRRMELAGDFPQRIRVSKRRVGHYSDEVYAWQASLDRVVIEGEG